ncbi:MAG TPA: lysophospholipid acyltransferase family protein [Terriglobales bacterium]|nr:lysophospholipid acyltransferase family protein [Terriglobales bacterium]
MSTAAPQPSSDSSSHRVFTLRQRAALWLISWAGFLVIRLIGPTLRFSISFEEGAAEGLETLRGIGPFWHRCVFPAAYIWRDMQVRVMTSRSFDGEYIARIIHKLGFAAVRGSSSRGAVGALLGMRRALERGFNVAFTIDGPRGPCYVAKPGPVLLAKLTGFPVVPFYIALEDPWVLNTWDRFMIPKPFSRALMRVGGYIHVPADADDDQLAQFHQEMQTTLERVREFAEKNVPLVGSPQFPLHERREVTRDEASG